MLCGLALLILTSSGFAESNLLTNPGFDKGAAVFTIGPSMSASWYNPDEAGHGIMIHLLDAEQAWMCWFTFDLGGNPAWICALGSISGDTLVFAQAFTVEGGNFPPLFDPDQIVEVPWGSITVTFTGCDSGAMEWSTTAQGFQSGSMPLIRLTSLWGNECPPPTTPVPVASVSVTPPSTTLTVGATTQLAATPKDAAGNALSGRTVVWTSSNTAVATVSGTGLVTGQLAGGPVTITATSEGKAGTSTVTVTPAPQFSIKLGVWEGTLPSAPAGSGRLSFRVTSATSLTFLSSKVPTFGNMNGCSSTWNNVVAIAADKSFTANLSASNTSLTFTGKFDSDVAATGTAEGVCGGDLMFLGQTFEAVWVSN